ncbi:MAG: DNA-processing protein DprA [Aggregatilineales bacterium]
MTVSTAWLALCLQQRIGTKTLQALMTEFDSPENILAADTKALKAVKGVGAKIAESIQSIDLSAIEDARQQWQKADVQLCPIHNPAYPTLLATLEDAPPVIFSRGLFDTSLHTKTAAIIGTRNPSPHAEDTAFRLAQVLAQRGYTIISGLAKGIDSAAHRGALSVMDGKTIAVLGSGVLKIYPSENHNLAKNIMQHGYLMSEVAPDATTNAARLVARNRLITGMSQHVFVVETAIDGGAMHAARFARKQGRHLYACIFPETGNLQLLRDKAIAIVPDLAKSEHLPD